MSHLKYFKKCLTQNVPNKCLTQNIPNKCLTQKMSQICSDQNVSWNVSLKMCHTKCFKKCPAQNVSLEPQCLYFWLIFLNRGTLGWCKFSLLVSLQLSNHEDLSSFSLFRFLLSSLHLSSDPNFRLIYWWQSWNQRRQISSLHYHNHQHFI